MTAEGHERRFDAPPTISDLPQSTDNIKRTHSPCIGADCTTDRDGRDKAAAIEWGNLRAQTLALSTCQIPCRFVPAHQRITPTDYAIARWSAPMRDCLRSGHLSQVNETHR